MSCLPSLPAACRKHPKLLALLNSEVHELEHSIAGLRAAKAHQRSLIAQKLQATQDIRALQREAHDIATRIRHAAQMVFGPRDARLTEFHVKPRQRKRK